MSTIAVYDLFINHNGVGDPVKRFTYEIDAVSAAIRAKQGITLTRCPGSMVIKQIRYRDDDGKLRKRLGSDPVRMWTFDGSTWTEHEPQKPKRVAKKKEPTPDWLNGPTLKTATEW